MFVFFTTFLQDVRFQGCIVTQAHVNYHIIIIRDLLFFFWNLSNEFHVSIIEDADPPFNQGETQPPP